MSAQVEMSREQIVARLLNGLPACSVPSDSSGAKTLFMQFIEPLLAALKIPCHLVEVYTVERRCRNASMISGQIIVFDHAQLELFERLESLVNVNERGLIAATMQRPFAEAARAAQHAGLYRFFLNRAAESLSLTRSLSTVAIPTNTKRWQTMVIMLHEAAHALPHNHPLREALGIRATLDASIMMDEQIIAISGRMNETLDLGFDASWAAILSQDWNATRDDLSLGDDAIFETFSQVATDPRFLEELVCDNFAISNLGNILQDALSDMNRADREEETIAVLIAVNRAFLHLRLISYIDEVSSDWELHIHEEKINPLKLNVMVELGFRSNLVVQQILTVARELCGSHMEDWLRENILSDQKIHTERLLQTANEIFEMTLLSAHFHSELPSLLAEDGVDMASFGSNWIRAFEDTDERWISMVDDMRRGGPVQLTPTPSK